MNGAGVEADTQGSWLWWETRKKGVRGGLGTCWRACRHLAMQIWTSGEWAGPEVHFTVTKTQRLPPERDSPRLSILPSYRPHLSTSVTLFGASRPAWARLRRLGWQGMMYLVVIDGEEPASPSCLLSPSEMLHSPLPCTGSKPSGDIPDVFISYRRNSGSQLAR